MNKEKTALNQKYLLKNNLATYNQQQQKILTHKYKDANNQNQLSRL